MYVELLTGENSVLPKRSIGYALQNRLRAGKPEKEIQQMGKREI